MVSSAQKKTIERDSEGQFGFKDGDQVIIPV